MGVPGDDQRDGKVFRRPRQALGGLMGQGEGPHQPPKGLCAPLPPSHVTWRGGGASPRAAAPPGLGGKFPRGGAPTSPGYVRWGGRGAQPLSGLMCPLPLAHKAPPTLAGASETHFGHTSHHLVPPEQFRTPIPFVQYTDLHLRTIPELLVMSGISSGTPNNLR
mgnify:CR=1 FL=1